MQAARITKSREQAALFVVPSIIYWLHNNVQFLTLKYVDAPTYQILGNLKIVTTGLLFWLCLRRKLTPLQWMALLLLMMGAATSQVSPALHTCIAGLRALPLPVVRKHQQSYDARTRCTMRKLHAFFHSTERNIICSAFAISTCLPSFPLTLLHQGRLQVDSRSACSSLDSLQIKSGCEGSSLLQAPPLVSQRFPDIVLMLAEIAVSRRRRFF